jgi:hypothetical protein
LIIKFDNFLPAEEQNEENEAVDLEDEIIHIASYVPSINVEVSAEACARPDDSLERHVTLNTKNISTELENHEACDDVIEIVEELACKKSLIINESDGSIQYPGEISPEIANKSTDLLDLIPVLKNVKITKLDIFSCEQQPKTSEITSDQVSYDPDLVEPFELDPTYDYNRNIVAESRFSLHKSLSQND